MSRPGLLDRRALSLRDRLPYTAYVGGVLDYAGGYSAIPWRATTATASPRFHQLDLRVDKTWPDRSTKLTAYLELRNAYNRKNPEGLWYRYDYARSKIGVIFPSFPVLGLRGEL